jgi:acyl carrier protein
MNVSRDQIVQLVQQCVCQLGEELEVSALKDPTEETPLMGEKSGVDSIALVSLIVEIETRFAEEYNVEVVLADDRAMSSLRSPFRRVGALVDYVESQIDQAAGAKCRHANNSNNRFP